MNNNIFQKKVFKRLDKIDSKLDMIQSQLLSDKTKYRKRLAKELTHRLPNTLQPNIKSDWEASWFGDIYSSHYLDTTDGYGNSCDINILNGKIKTDLDKKVTDMGKNYDGKEIIIHNPTNYKELMYIKHICQKFYNDYFK